MSNRCRICAKSPTNISSAPVSLSRPSSAEPKRPCSSASSRILAFRNACRHGCFFQQYFKGRKASVPFDQCGHRTQATARCDVKIPDLRRDTRAVIVKQKVSGGGVSGKMNLAHRVRRDCMQRARGIETMIHRIDIKVVDVEQNAATAAFVNLCQEVELRDFGRAELQVTRHVLDEDRPLQDFLHLGDMRNDLIACSARIRQWQQIVEMAWTERAPA